MPTPFCFRQRETAGFDLNRIPTADSDLFTNFPAGGRFWQNVVTALPFVFIWIVLVNQLRVEWTINPQYGYGWVVMPLCLGLLWRRWQSLPAIKPYGSELRTQKMIVALFGLLAFMWLPTRLIQEANPEWRLVSWALAVEVIGLVLCAIYLGMGRERLGQLAFPICFFFVAIPWPTPIEQPVIQLLTRLNSAIAVEVLGGMGIPVIQHGNLIEISTGTVGIDEACSGIRSLQSTLMISLFFGEFYRMSRARRLFLIPVGFLVAMAFNVCRMVFLTTEAYKKGIEAIGKYHDPAGITITFVCTAVLWGLAVLFKRSKSPTCPQPANSTSQKPKVLDFRFSTLRRLALRFLLWLIVVEVGSEVWYRCIESPPAPSAQWSIMFPISDPTYKSVAISADTALLLRFDEGKQGGWIDPDGFRWEAFYFDWQPGRVAGYLAKRHTPEICLPAAGRELISGPVLTMMNINGVVLPVRSYVFQTDGKPVYVFHCRWEAGVNSDAYVTHESARFDLIRGIWSGRGKQGQKVLELVVSGCPDAAQANAALIRQLQDLVKVERPEPDQQPGRSS